MDNREPDGKIPASERLKELLLNKSKLGKLVFVIITAVIALLLLSSAFCPDNDTGRRTGLTEPKGSGFDPYELMSVSLTGYEGCGRIAAEVDQTVLKYALTDIVNGPATPREKAAYERLLCSVYYEIPDQGNGRLKNGTTVEIQARYSKDCADALGITAEVRPYSYRVEGLGDGTAYDPFAGLKVSFSGTERNGQISFDTSRCVSFVQEKVQFTADMSGKRNGDIVTVRAESVSDIESLNAMLTETEKQYTVEGLNRYAGSLDGVSTANIRRSISDFANQRVNTQEFASLTADSGYKFTYDTSFEEVGAYYLTDDSKYEAHYVCILKLTRKATCIVAPDDAPQYSVGDVAESYAYVAVTYRYITVTPGGEADYYDFIVNHSYTKPSAEDNFREVYGETVDMYKTVKNFKVAEIVDQQ